MNQYQEIVTKAILNRTKKSFTNAYEVDAPDADTVLGCWVINHSFYGTRMKSSVLVHGHFDVNVWYSYDGNSKTNVLTQQFSYEEEIATGSIENENAEVKVNSLKQPTVSDVSLKEGKLHLVIDKELGVEVIGDTQIHVPYQFMEPNYMEETTIDVHSDYIQ